MSVLPDPPLSHLENGTRTTHLIVQLSELVPPVLGVRDLTGLGIYEALEKGSHPNKQATCCDLYTQGGRRRKARTESTESTLIP